MTSTWTFRYVSARYACELETPSSCGGRRSPMGWWRSVPVQPCQKYRKGIAGSSVPVFRVFLVPLRQGTIGTDIGFDVILTSRASLSSPRRGLASLPAEVSSAAKWCGGSDSLPLPRSAGFYVPEPRSRCCPLWDSWPSQPSVKRHGRTVLPQARFTVGAASSHPLTPRQ